MPRCRRRWSGSRASTRRKRRGSAPRSCRSAKKCQARCALPSSCSSSPSASCSSSRASTSGTSCSRAPRVVDGDRRARRPRREPGRMVRQLLAENLPLALAGTLVGLVIAIASFSILRQLVPPAMRASAELGLDVRVLGFTSRSLSPRRSSWARPRARRLADGSERRAAPRDGPDGLHRGRTPAERSRRRRGEPRHRAARGREPPDADVLLAHGQYSDLHVGSVSR